MFEPTVHRGKDTIHASPVQTDSTLLANNMLRPFMQPFARCCVLFGVFVQSLKPVKTFSYA